LQNDSALVPRDVRFRFVDEPGLEEVRTLENQSRVWSARVYAALKDEYPDGGPDLVEFADYQGDGCVTLQARRTMDPALRNATVVVRLYTTVEMIAVLNGHVGRDSGFRKICDYERFALRFADRILWPGGDVLGTFQRFYGSDALAQGDLVRHPVPESLAQPAPTSVPPTDGPLRFLYAGRLERRKGVHNLIRAFTALPGEDWSLTLVGADTDTGPLGVSVREQLELMVADDPRIELTGAVASQELVDLFAQHDIGVVPSLWECWPNVALQCLAANRPLVGTPVGGLAEIVRPGLSGWLAADTSDDALLEAVESLVVRGRSQVAGLTEQRGPRQRFEQLTPADEVRERYRALVEASRRAGRRHGSAPPSATTVSVVVTYFHLHDHIADTIESILAQTHPDVEVIVVNDGSFADQDRVLSELASVYPITILTQQNSGVSSARNFGIAQSHGRYVLPFDADNLLDPVFVERCVTVLDEDPDAAYATSWLVCIDAEGTPIVQPEFWYRPLGNFCSSVRDENVAGDAAAVIRRSVFDRGFWYGADLTSYEDWALYRRLGRAGLYGHVIPEPLLLYRVREQSMLRPVGERTSDRLLGEMDAHVREQEMLWLSRG
ncbi:MAG: glycosyltransferase, partial [Gaiellales bacterium]